MAIKSNDKNWGNKKDINYVGKDFASLKENLIDFTKTYFPNTYSDFNESSPGMVFVEMASYIGDVLSFYQDAQLKESLLLHATERKNIMSLAQSMGYKPKVTTPAVTTLTIYQLVPAAGAPNYEPDERLFLRIKEGLEVSTNTGIIFRTTDVVDFSQETDREYDVYERDNSGLPTFYLVTKKVKAISAIQKTITTSVPLNERDYPSITLSDNNIISITSVTDSDNNKYYEVPYLAQESIFVEQENTAYNGNLHQNSSTVPYLLEIQKVPRRFSVKINNDNTIDLQFGSGDVNLADEQILPNTKNIGIGTANSISRLNMGIDPSNFLKTNTFGIAPAGKTLTIKYLIGGGVEANINSNQLNIINKIEFDEDILSINTSLLSTYQAGKESLAVDNLESATGGRGGESIEEIRQNALAMFGSQNRAVTREDYIVRALSMPARYGSVAKVYVSPDSEVDVNSPNTILSNPKNVSEFIGLVEELQSKNRQEIQKGIISYINQRKHGISQQNNPFAINMYVLGYDSNKNLTNLNLAAKENLKTYVSQYRMITDGVNILDGFIVNIGVDFEIVCYSDYNKREVVTNCITELQEYFNTDNWTFNKTINISELELVIANVEGVMSVPSVKIYNLCGSDGTYSPNKYNIEQATRGKIIFPSMDPCVFEVKYPNKDIKGRAL